MKKKHDTLSYKDKILALRVGSFLGVGNGIFTPVLLLPLL